MKINTFLFGGVNLIAIFTPSNINNHIMKTAIHTKHQRQVNREPKNMSKSVRLDIKKECNARIKELSKDNTKPYAVALYTNILTKLKN